MTLDGNNSGDNFDGIDWNSEDDLEIENHTLNSSSSLATPSAASVARSNASAEASSSTCPSNSGLIKHFVGMGFPEKDVVKAIEENEKTAGEDKANLILETLLTYKALENSPQGYQQIDPEQNAESDHCSSDYYENLPGELSDTDNSSENEGTIIPLSNSEDKVLFLADMGYTVEEASIAIERCGTNSSVSELADFISAAQMARALEADHRELYEDKPRPNILNGLSKLKKRRNHHSDLLDRKRQRGLHDEDDEIVRLPNPMVGFGVPTDSSYLVVKRNLPDAAVGPPFFYYENVALAPKGVWTTISRFLYDIEPEFVDSKYFCAAARKRGYVHNLPINNRYPLLPLPPSTIHEALPLTRKWWPEWDTRTKLNCLQTTIGSAKLTERIRKALEAYDGDPPLRVQKYVLDECRKWNLVWVGRNKLAPLETDEYEMLLGFPKNHTRGGGISRTDRYKSLGNSFQVRVSCQLLYHKQYMARWLRQRIAQMFVTVCNCISYGNAAAAGEVIVSRFLVFQVDTVAYHLSVLKEIFPGGLNLLSLFSGIGGAEVALHRLGIPLKTVVSVEKSEVNRNIMRSWWEQTNQKGTLIDLADVQELNGDRLEQMIHTFGGFDLIVGGSPCNNLAGSNRVSRDGLEGTESSLFYDYFRILDLVKCIMGKPQ